MKDYGCGALGCPAKLDEHHLMCSRHWALVPEQIKGWARDTYEPVPTSGAYPIRWPDPRYLISVTAAVLSVAVKEQASPEALAALWREIERYSPEGRATNLYKIAEAADYKILLRLLEEDLGVQSS